MYLTQRQNLHKGTQQMQCISVESKKVKDPPLSAIKTL